MSGDNLYLKAPTMAEEPVVPDGSLEYSIDTYQFQGGEIPADLVNKAQPPQDVPVYEGSTPMMVLTGMEGLDFWIYESDAATQAVIDYYKVDMPKQGWNLDSEETTEQEFLSTQIASRAGAELRTLFVITSVY